MHSRLLRPRHLAAYLLCGLAAACTQSPDPLRPTSNDDQRAEQQAERYGTVFEKGLFSFGTRRDEAPEAGAAGIGVNAYLWRATLATLDFLPLASADPFGGLIVSEWYAPPATPNERLKVQASITGQALRADALGVQVFRQVRGADGAWADALTSPATARELEDRILTQARDLRIAAAAG